MSEGWRTTQPPPAPDYPTLIAAIEDQSCFVGIHYTASTVKHSPGAGSFPTTRKGSKPRSRFHQRRPQTTQSSGKQSCAAQLGREERKHREQEAAA